MKNILLAVSTMFVFAASEGVAVATPINFDLAGESGGSSVSVTGSTGFLNWGDITANLASDLDDQIFTLNDGETKEIDFFTLTVSGLSWDEDYSIEATLAFDHPDIGESTGFGGGTFSTFFGILSGGTLSWNAATLPDYFTDSFGNNISVNFESGSVFGLGNSTTVHAYITNNGGGTAPVPEPTAMLLFGAGLVGVAAFGRKRRAE